MFQGYKVKAIGRENFWEIEHDFSLESFPTDTCISKIPHNPLHAAMKAMEKMDYIKLNRCTLEVYNIATGATKTYDQETLDYELALEKLVG